MVVDGGVADEALLDSYEAERWPIGRFVLRFTDRATAIATSDRPLVRLMRTQMAPRLVSIVFRLSRLGAFGFRTLAQLRINYRRSPAVDEGEPPPRRGPKAGDRLPDAHIVEHGRERWLQEALATPTYHLLLCGPGESWNNDQLARLSERYARLVAVHRLARSGSRRPPRRPWRGVRAARRRAGGTLPRASRRPHRLPQRRHGPTRPRALPRTLASGRGAGAPG